MRIEKVRVRNVPYDSLELAKNQITKPYDLLSSFQS